MLFRRLELLKLVEKLALSLEKFEAEFSGRKHAADTMGDPGGSCEAARFFFIQKVQSSWELFQERVHLAGRSGEHLKDLVEVDVAELDSDTRGSKRRKKDGTAGTNNSNGTGDEGSKIVDEDQLKSSKAQKLLAAASNSVVGALFPFSDFFDDVPGGLFSGHLERDVEAAEGCFRYLQTVFQEVAECVPFELLRNGSERGNYLVTTHARIVAMTCTHAALKRSELIKLNFKYDTLIMEEAGQILEVGLSCFQEEVGGRGDLGVLLVVLFESCVRKMIPVPQFWLCVVNRLARVSVSRGRLVACVPWWRRHANRGQHQQRQQTLAGARRYSGVVSRSILTTVA